MSKTTAFVTGITGQDGAYLSRLLVSKGYAVYGGIRRGWTPNLERLAALGIERSVNLLPFDLLDSAHVLDVIGELQPDELYNLAAHSSVDPSSAHPVDAADLDAFGAARILDAIRRASPATRFFQASSSEMFGNARVAPQCEKTPFCPRNAYGISKIYAHWTTVNHREAYGLHASSGILFNHESPLRGRGFVTRKITLALARIKDGSQDVLELGNLDAHRDWGFAGDYVQGMWLMLQQNHADDYVLATGTPHSVRQFVDQASQALGLELEWHGNAEREVGIDRCTGVVRIRVNPDFYRPAESGVLTGNASKAMRELGWRPTTDLTTLARMMALTDDERVRTGRLHF